MFGGKNRFSRDLYLLSFKIHLWKYWGTSCATAITPKAALAFLADNNMAEFGSRMVK
jgi:hypothetical protein